MVDLETDGNPTQQFFDLAIVAVGYERRCRWVVDTVSITASNKLGLEFGFLAEASYDDNRAYFERKSYRIINGLNDDVVPEIAGEILPATASAAVRIFVDISSMSREMIANVALAIELARSRASMIVTVAYAPSKFSGPFKAAPIRSARPIKPALAGWSSQPEKPLGTIFGLGCEPGLALGALQVLESDKAWVFQPQGVDSKFDAAMKAANAHLADIFDVSRFDYDIAKPTSTRGRFEALLNAVDASFRLIVVPFGPKIFAWLTLATIIFTSRNRIGIWTFSSKEQAAIVDRDAHGPIVWHNITLSKYPDKLAPE